MRLLLLHQRLFNVLQRGELANRILSVGSMDRALLIADNLEGAEGQKFQHLSGRGFLTITGEAGALTLLHGSSLAREAAGGLAREAAVA
jgi:hypothetical protein